VAPLNLEYHIEVSPNPSTPEGVVKGEDQITNDLKAEMQMLKLVAEEMERKANKRVNPVG
jgi:hypothetical protein